MFGVYPTRRCAPLLGVLHEGLGEDVGNCRGAAVTQNVALFGSLGVISWAARKLCPFWRNVVSGIRNLLDMQVTDEEPASGHKDVYLAGTPKGAFLRKYGQNHRNTTFPPFGGHGFLVGKRTSFFFWVLIWVLHIDRARRGVLTVVNQLNLSTLVAG